MWIWTICEYVRSLDRLNRRLFLSFFFSFFFFPSHLETSCFLNWMNFKVMVTHLKSENWGFSHSLPVSWVVGAIHGNSEFTSWSKLAWWFVFIAFGGKNKPHQPGPDFPRAHHSGTYYPLCEVSRSSAFHSFPSCWEWSFCSLLGFPSAGVEEQREKPKHY